MPRFLFRSHHISLSRGRNRAETVFYGFFVGILTVIIRSINPAYPEGVMLAILLMNAFASLIDYFVVKVNVNRRMARYAQ